MEIILECVVGSARIVRKVGEASDMQDAPIQNQGELPYIKRFGQGHRNGAARVGGRCTPGITGRWSAGTEKVRSQGVSLRADLHSHPTTSVWVNIVPYACEVGDGGACNSYRGGWDNCWY